MQSPRGFNSSLLGVGAVLALFLACRRSATEQGTAAHHPAPPATRGYILISIDTLRADHLGCYGYARPTSPFLDSLARRATLFEEAYAQFPSTLVSHMSMLTGLYPREHGVFPPNAVLPREVELVPEVFQRHGFRTAGFTEGGFVSGRYGFRRGFDTFASRERDHSRPIEKTFRRGVEFLEGLRQDDRFFLFLHTYAVHTPYDAPAEFQEPFWPDEAPEQAIQPSGAELTRWSLLGDAPPPRVVEWLRALYDAGIRQTDDVLRRFFADLDRLGLSDEVTVVITSDHGEEFLEHGRFNHTQLYRETLRVPLLVVHPQRREAVRHRGVVQLVDLAPTLYELARVKPQGKPSGVSRAGLLGRSLPPQPGSAWADAQEGMRAVYRGEQKNLESLLLFDPPPGRYLARRATFDANQGHLRLEARSYEQPRRLVVREGKRILTETLLSPAWSPLPLDLSAPARLILEADGCTFPSSAKRQEPQCFGFEVRGARLARLELYDVDQDATQRSDLSRQRSQSTRKLLRELLAFQPTAIGPVSAPPLDPALEESLRSLGYLQ